MKYISLDERVENAFGAEANCSYGGEYLAILHDNWRDVARSLRRGLLLIVAFMVGFVLLESAKSGEVTLGPLRISSVWAVLTVVPVLVSALSYECVGLLAAFALIREVVGKVTRELHPSVYENDLELMLAPTVVTLVGVGIGLSWEDLRKTAPGLPGAVLYITSVGIFVCIVLGSIGFLVYAYITLFDSHNTSALAVSLSLAAATLFLVRTIAFTLHSGEEF
jgi:hypothetical protein